MEGAELIEALMEGAELIEARMKGADLRLARMEGADLIGADLKSTDLRDWTFVRTSLRSVDFTGATHNMTQADVNAAYGDSGTKLPEGFVVPCHWDNQILFWTTEDTKYKAWLKAGAVPVPRNPDGSCP